MGVFNFQNNSFFFIFELEKWVHKNSSDFFLTTEQ